MCSYLGTDRNRASREHCIHCGCDEKHGIRCTFCRLLVFVFSIAYVLLYTLVARPRPEKGRAGQTTAVCIVHEERVDYHAASH